MNNIDYFKEAIDTINNPEAKEFAWNVARSIPPYFYEVGASSSGKYHPPFAHGKLGLLRHSLAVVRFVNAMLENPKDEDTLTEDEKDLIRIAALFHDCLKYGAQEDYDKGIASGHASTKFSHPLLASKWIMEQEGLSIEQKQFIADCIASHMGPYTTSKFDPDTVLPEPKTVAQTIVHKADDIASRIDCELDFDF